MTSRCIFDNKIWKSIVEFRLFFLIYGMAVFDEKGITYGVIHIKRGQYLRSIRHLQTDLEYLENHAVKTYSLSTLKRAIDSLITQEKITTEQTELGTLFTVLNYEEYQRLDNYKNANLEQMENTDRTDGEQIQNNNKNVKKDKKVKKKDIYAEFVNLTKEEHQKLIEKFGEEKAKDWIERINLYKGSTGRKYNSDYLTILNWSRKEEKEAQSKVTPIITPQAQAKKDKIKLLYYNT